MSSFNLDGNVFIALLYFSSLQYSTQNQFIFLVGEIIYFPSLTQCVSKDRTSERERERERDRRRYVISSRLYLVQPMQA